MGVHNKNLNILFIIGITIFLEQLVRKFSRVSKFCPLKQRMRHIVRQDNVRDIIEYSHRKPVIRRLKLVSSSKL
jgi:hypothetical protein